MLVCDKCAGKIIDGSQFCPHCGDPVSAADRAEEAISSSSVAQVELSFGRSSSANYEQAVGIARNIPTYREEGEGGSVRHAIIVAISEVELLINLWALVGTWKSARMLINGQPATKSALVYKGVGCYRNRQKAFDPNQHCFGETQWEFNIWGCKRLEMPLHEWGGGWLELGRMDSKGVWHVDKARIRHELELKVHEHELCPVLDKKRVFETLDSLPDEISPRQNPNWIYRTEYQEIRGDYKEVAVGVRPVLKKAQVYVLGNYKPAWEFEDQESSRQTENVIKVQLELPAATSSSAAKRPPKKSGCVVFLFGLFLVASAVAWAICGT
jgi:hypothetical protein